MIPDYPRLNFPAVKLRISQRGEQMTVWDPLRGIYLVQATIVRAVRVLPVPDTLN